MYKNGKPNYNEIIFSVEQIQDIINSYQNGESSVSIGKRYNTTHKPILKIIHKNNIEINVSRSHRKYSVDESYFDVIDTPNKAYVVGLLSADGCNYIKKSTISISLEECDKEILEKICIDMKNEHPLEYIDYSNKHDFGYSYKNQYRMLIFSSHMCNRLSEIGVVPNKSLLLEFSSAIPKEYYSDYVRGVFDGDGTFGVHNIEKYNGTITVSITSTYMFCSYLQIFLHDNMGITSKIVESSNHNGITHDIRISTKSDTKKFLDWIYQDAILYLQRKHDIYVNHYNINNSLVA